MLDSLRRRCDTLSLEVHHYHHFTEEPNRLLQTINDKLDRILEKENQQMASLAEFQTKIDNINRNTTESAAAAQAIAAMLKDLRDRLDQVLTDAGVPAAEEQQILAQLDTAVESSTQTATFLKQVASGPVTEPEPDPVPTPEPTPAPEGGGTSARRR